MLLNSLDLQCFHVVIELRTKRDNSQQATTVFKGDLSPLIYSMNKFVTNKSKLPQDGAQVFPSCDPVRGSHDSQSPHVMT